MVSSIGGYTCGQCHESGLGMQGHYVTLGNGGKKPCGSCGQMTCWEGFTCQVDQTEYRQAVRRYYGRLCPKTGEYQR